MEEWYKLSFAEFCSVNPKVRILGKEAVPYVEIKDIVPGRKKCHSSTNKYLSNGSRFINNDVLFSRITPCLENGKIAQVSNLPGGVGYGSTEFIVFRAIDDRSDADFLFYLCLWDEIKDYAISNFVGSSGRQRVPTECFKDLHLSLPPLQEQKAIAAVLSSLDDKIDLLHRQNQTLEAIAETLFRQWFIEEAGEDWELIKIADVAHINKDNITSNFMFNEIEYLDTGSITKGVIDGFQRFDILNAPSRAQRLVKEKDIVYSLVRPIQRHYGILSNIPENLVVSTGFCVIRATKVSPFFLYLLLTNNETVEYLDMVAEASTSTYPSIKPSDIANVEFLHPPKHVMDHFHDSVSGLWKKILSNSHQIQTLTTLRDTLLPKLMSGEVRVKL